MELLQAVARKVLGGWHTYITVSIVVSLFGLTSFYLQQRTTMETLGTSWPGTSLRQTGCNNASLMQSWESAIEKGPEHNLRQTGCSNASLLLQSWESATE